MRGTDVLLAVNSLLWGLWLLLSVGAGVVPSSTDAYFNVPIVILVALSTAAILLRLQVIREGLARRALDIALVASLLAFLPYLAFSSRGV